VSKIKILLIVLSFGLGSTAQQQKSEDILMFKPSDLLSLKAVAATIDCTPLVIKGAREEWGHAKACESFKELIAGEDQSVLHLFGDSAYVCPGPFGTLFLVGGTLHPSKWAIKNKIPSIINLLIFKNGIKQGTVTSEGIWQALSPDASSTYRYHGQPMAILKEKMPNISFYLDIDEEHLSTGGSDEKPWFTIQRSTGRYIATYQFLGHEQIPEDGKCFRFEHQFTDADKGVWQIIKN
jgi:hypothetical protein